MPLTRLERARCIQREILSLLCLPISPQRQRGIGEQNTAIIAHFVEFVKIYMKGIRRVTGVFAHRFVPPFHRQFFIRIVDKNNGMCYNMKNALRRKY